MKDRDKLVQHAAHVLIECGVSGFTFYLGESLVYQLEGLAHTLAELPLSNPNASMCRTKATQLCCVLPRLRQFLKERARQLQVDGHLTDAPFISAKTARLLELIEGNFERFQEKPSYKGIIFVEQVALTFPLAHVLNHHFNQPGCGGSVAGVRAAAISGVGTMSNSLRSGVLESFKQVEPRSFEPRAVFH